MKFQHLLPILVALSSIAHAEMKQPGELVDLKCGQMNRSNDVCLAEVTGMDKLAIRVKQMTMPPNDDASITFEKRDGIVYSVKPLNTMGASTVEYKALIPFKDYPSGKTLYKEVILRVVHVMAAAVEPTATLLIDGKVVGEGFDWHPVNTTL